MSGATKNTSACMACTGSATINTKCQSEFGPEWEKVGDTGCGSCKFNGAVIGRRATCKQTTYQGNRLSCCLGNGSGASNLTCDPTWTSSSGNCDGVLSDYCSQGSNAFDAAKCFEWRSSRPTQGKASAIAAIKAKPSLLDRADVKSFARDLANSGDSSLDSVVSTYCQANPSSDLCSCINSAANTSLGINPKCVDAKCLSTGYLVANQVSTACPDIVSCTQINNLKSAGISLISSVETSQSCGNTQTPTETPTTETSSSSWILFFVLVALIFIVLTGVSLYAFTDVFKYI